MKNRIKNRADVVIFSLLGISTLLLWLVSHILKVSTYYYPGTTSFAENIELKLDIPIYLQSALFLLVASIYFGWAFLTSKKTMFRLNGVIYILIGWYWVMLWLFTGLYVVTNSNVLVDQISVWLGLSNGFQATLFITVATAFISWGIYTLKKKSNHY
ncbi:MAG: hypothetical protein V5783_04190 [Pontiella sp.]